MDIQLVILLAIGSLLIGLVAGLLLSLLFRATGKRRQKEYIRKQDLVEVVRFWMDQGGKRIVPEVSGKFIGSLDELSSVEQARLTHLLEQLRIIFAPPPKIIQKPADSNHKAEAVAPITAKPVSSVNTGIEPPPASSIKMDLVNAIAKTLQPEIGVTHFAGQTIVAQVDQILQERLLGTELGKKGIRLVELPDKSMLIMVGLTQYTGVEDVPDPEVQAVIRAAVQEWEHRYTPIQD